VRISLGDELESDKQRTKVVHNNPGSTTVIEDDFTFKLDYSQRDQTRFIVRVWEKRIIGNASRYDVSIL
jgi:hypothetical protein